MTGSDILAELRASGLRTFPGAHSKSPWPGHDDLAVKDKTFAYLAGEGGPFSLSVKLPYRSEMVLDLPCAQPTGYGLGKSCWVTLTPPGDAMPGIDQLKDWIDESYRAQAPKRLVKDLDARGD